MEYPASRLVLFWGLGEGGVHDIECALAEHGLALAPEEEKMQAPELRWTHRWPTQAGWYWCKSKRLGVEHGRTTAITVVHVTRNGSNLLRVGKYSLEEIHQYSERLWAGPLVPPNASDCED